MLRNLSRSESLLFAWDRIDLFKFTGEFVTRKNGLGTENFCRESEKLWRERNDLKRCEKSVGEGRLSTRVRVKLNFLNDIR